MLINFGYNLKNYLKKHGQPLVNTVSELKMHPVYVGRQPIFDRSEKIIGFELLFRSGHTTVAEFYDEHAATHDLLRAAFVDIGIEQLVGQHQAFLNLTRSFFHNPILSTLPSHQCTLELSPDIVIDAELFALLQTHKQEGFCIALDSRHVLTQPDYAVRIADFIKVDVLHDDPAQLRGQLIEKMPKCNHALIATKVETADTYHLCQGLGFNYFQGFFLSFPNVIAGQRLEGNKLALIKLLDLLQQPQSTTEEMTRLVSSDAALSLEMLKLINSPRFRRLQPIESVRQAVLLLGRSEIRRLTLLLSLRNLATGPMSMEQTLIRARMAAHLAPILNRADESERFFTLGLLSTIDRLFGIPIAEIVRKMRLTSEIREALLDRDGPLAIIIDILDAFEQPDIPLPDDLAVTPEILGQLYFTAVSEAHSDLAHLTDEEIE